MLRRFTENRVGRKGLKTWTLRLAVQGGFAALLVLLGLLFLRFVRAIEAGRLPLPDRPTGAEGFLPISGLMGALDWLYQGRLNAIHPAATVLFLLFTASALILRKNFCSWICPVGLLSESLARLGRRLFGRNFRPWKWLDVVLRSLKYLLLGFFAFSILGMGAAALSEFIHSDYNRVSDVKMFYFFARLSGTAALVIAALALGSIFVNGFWCRYLCPYGAWLGLFSWASPLKVRRNAETCIDCGLCDRVCMARLPVSKKARIVSPECTGCLDCVASCPVPNTLVMGTRRRAWSALRYGAGVLLVFLAGWLIARATGRWESAVSDAEYLRLFEILDRLDHLGR